MRRVAVIGTSCCGKTRFAQRLATLLDDPHIELDALYWGPRWTPEPRERFRQRVASAIDAPHWVVDGNYRPVRDLVWHRATTVVWLDYGFPRIFARALRRTMRRVWHRERLFGGNRETFRQAFLSRDSILWWVVTSHRRRRREYAAARRGAEYAHLEWVVCTHPRDAERFLDRLARARAADSRPPPAV
ncbi:MAG: hypothetical protein GF330_07775 [Candidatus Eisenbacteria bacterium]|nr:hypothetical protein [Candidatus Eisenbacteria bacterium]